jgi:hypothetical protein
MNLDDTTPFLFDGGAIAYRRCLIVGLPNQTDHLNKVC